MKHIEGRQRAIRELKKQLQREGTPRRDMMLIALVTGTAGFWLSYLLLRAGVARMWIRYPLAVWLSYGVFLGMLRIWLERVRSRDADSSLDLADLDVTLDIPAGRVDVVPEPSFGGGGGFGGGGTGRSWGLGSSSPKSVVGSSGRSGGGIDASVDLDDAVLLILPIIIVFSVIFAGVYLAPAILAEVLLDGALIAGLYHQYKHVPTQHWVRTGIGKTFWLFSIAAVLLGVAGFAIQAKLPHATSFGVLWDTVFR